jgi:transposase
MPGIVTESYGLRRKSGCVHFAAARRAGKPRVDEPEGACDVRADHLRNRVFWIDVPGHAGGPGAIGLNRRRQVEDFSMPNLFVLFVAFFLAINFGLLDFLIQTS